MYAKEMCSVAATDLVYSCPIFNTHIISTPKMKNCNWEVLTMFGSYSFFLSFSASRESLFIVFSQIGGGRVVRWCWINFQCRGVLQF